MSINISVLTGRLTADPELKYTANNVPVTSFSLAVDRKYQPKGEEKTTDFIDCVAWRNTAEFISKYFQKGSMIGIEGEIQTRTYTDKEGKKRKVTEIVINNASFCGSKAASGSTDNTSEPEADPLAALAEKMNEPSEFQDFEDADLPF